MRGWYIPFRCTSDGEKYSNPIGVSLSLQGKHSNVGKYYCKIKTVAPKRIFGSVSRVV